ncbi:MAG: sigma-70 family RNA polymerase sigma factor [Planctomycetales bacterium]
MGNPRIQPLDTSFPIVLRDDPAENPSFDRGPRMVDQQSTGNSGERIEALLEQVRNGDRAALNALFEQHRGYLKNLLALRMSPDLKRRVDASDVVQETHAEAFRRIDDYLRRPPVTFRLWLRRIAMDRVAAAYRRHVRATRRSVAREVELPRDSSLGLGALLVDRNPGPSELFDRDEIVRRVRQSIDRLPDLDREIILLHNFEALTSRESAELLGITPDAARQRYGRAILRLRTLLIDQDDPRS